jgi:Ca-activated chloride channel family protein
MLKPLLSYLCVNCFVFSIIPNQINAMPLDPLPSVQLKLAAAHPVMLANKSDKVYLKISLMGTSSPINSDRSPINVALVLDKSGSMFGDRIAAAKEAAIMAVNSLQPQDIVSIISYDNTVNVLVPATKVADKMAILTQIQRLEADGSTALYAGVVQGADEVGKFMDTNHVNRVILLSDGQANVGPSSVSELAQLGQQLGAKGISVTTIGLGEGYNEDLMTQLASYSDGNHAFVQQSNDLITIFQREFGDVTSIIAKDVFLTIQCANEVRPVQLFGREADMQGQTVQLRLNQLPANQEKFVILQLEVPASAADSQRPLAKVELGYYDLRQRKNQQQQADIAVRFSTDAETVARAVDQAVMADAVAQVANQMTKEAVDLRDAGKVNEAKGLLDSAADYLRGSAKSYASPALTRQAEQTQNQAKQMGESDWNVQRKSLRQEQYKKDKQQTY